MADLFHHAPARALAVYAHPDDAEISCGGTLARWAAAGSEVHLLVLTRGDKGSADPAVDAEELAARRAVEVANAATALGLAGWEQVGVADGELANTAEVRGRVVAAVRAVRPDVVVCPDPTAVFFGDTYFNHHDHREAGWIALDAVSPAAGSPLYFPGAGAAHPVGQVLLSGTLEPNVWVDVGGTLEAKARALLCHESQLRAAAFGHEGGTDELVGSLLNQRAEEAGRRAGVRYAEGFRRLVLGR
jgi:LmbE family N-acetylglucosaminyl deacetylase